MSDLGDLLQPPCGTCGQPWNHIHACPGVPVDAKASGGQEHHPDCKFAWKGCCTCALARRSPAPLTVEAPEGACEVPDCEESKGHAGPAWQPDQLKTASSIQTHADPYAGTRPSPLVVDAVPVEETVIGATGNGMKSHDTYDTFMEVTGGEGNLWESEPEVHLLLKSNDGDFAQGWFRVSDLLVAIGRAVEPLPTDPPRAPGYCCDRCRAEERE